MDDRQRQMQVKEGAGLEDSRINTEFVDFLRKWSTPVLLVLCGLSVVYLLYTRQQQAADSRRNAAFMEMELTMGSGTPSPTALEDISRRYSDVGSVGLLTRLLAGDSRMRVAVLGVEPTAIPDETGRIPADAMLSEEARESYLRAAEADYRWVLERSRGHLDKALLTISAHYGLAAVAESRLDADAARSHYERVIELAERAKYPAHAVAARARIESLEHALVRRTLFSEDDLPARPMPGLQLRPDRAPSGLIPGIDTGLEPDGDGAAPLDFGPILPDMPEMPDAPMPMPTEPAPAEPAPTEPAPGEPAPDSGGR
ncbi:MAG: hypothetical protein EA378_02930 [Phycisphaerales bacterium]|nr:MAG: hypothetical protein EA378_02930 [Phycisphaerales bacterium]